MIAFVVALALTFGQAVMLALVTAAVLWLLLLGALEAALAVGRWRDGRGAGAAPKER